MIEDRAEIEEVCIPSFFTDAAEAQALLAAVKPGCLSFSTGAGGAQLFWRRDLSLRVIDLIQLASYDVDGTGTLSALRRLNKPLVFDIIRRIMAEAQGHQSEILCSVASYWQERQWR